MPSEQAVIGKKVIDHLNRWPDRPADFSAENLDKTAISCMMQHLAGKPFEKKYIDGTKIVMWPFAVYIRIHSDTNAGKIGAIQMLNNLDEWLTDKENELPDLGEGRTAQRFELTSLPSLAASYDDGTQDFQAIFGLTYKEKTGG